MYVVTLGFECRDRGLGIGDLAGGVNADVDDVIAVPGIVDPEHLVECGHTVGLGRRHLKLLGGVVQTSRADPTDLILQGVKNRQQQMATFIAAGPATADQPFVFLGVSDGPDED